MENLVFQDDREFQAFLSGKLGLSAGKKKYNLARRQIYYFYFEDLNDNVCRELAHRMTCFNGEAIVGRKEEKNKILLIASRQQYDDMLGQINTFNNPLKKILQPLKQALSNLDEQGLAFRFKNRKMDCSRTIRLMGVVNVTPDSFFDGGKFLKYGQATGYIDGMIREGVDILDLGGESTRPGAGKVSASEELKRIMPVLKYIKKNYKVPVSVDTYKSRVAEAVLSEGADIINDISGLRFDKKIAGIIARYRAGVVLMHIQGTPKDMQVAPSYKNLLGEIKSCLEQSIKIALENGIKFPNIIIDPGIGFGKSLEQNYIILNRLSEFKVLGRPILIGLSRKSLIGKVLKNEPADRLTGTLILNTVSALKGADFLRVHDIKEHKEMKTLLEYLKVQGADA